MNKIFIADNTTLLTSNKLLKFEKSIKVIYIDPPYNTKSTKSYKDNINSNIWLTNIINSIKASYKYLSDNGVIFISIDDNEYAYLKIECDKIFKKENFIGTFITQQSQRSNSKLINTVHEYILCYAKNKTQVKEFKIKRTEIIEDKKIIEKLCSTIKDVFKNKGINEANKLLKIKIKNICTEKNISWLKNYNCIDENGNIYFAKDLSTPSKPRTVNIPSINLFLQPLQTRGWSSDEKFIQLYNNNKLVYKGNRPYEKHLLVDAEDSAPSLLNFYSRQGTNDLNKLGLRGLFDTPKPVNLIKFLIKLVATQNDIVLDFFAGSGTTGQAVLELNKESNLNLNFILIQKNELIDKKSEIYTNCTKYKIKPTVPAILKLRIDTYLKNNLCTEKYEMENY